MLQTNKLNEDFFDELDSDEITQEEIEMDDNRTYILKNYKYFIAVSMNGKDFVNTKVKAVLDKIVPDNYMIFYVDDSNYENRKIEDMITTEEDAWEIVILFSQYIKHKDVKVFMRLFNEKRKWFPYLWTVEKDGKHVEYSFEEYIQEVITDTENEHDKVYKLIQEEVNNQLTYENRVLDLRHIDVSKCIIIDFKYIKYTHDVEIIDITGWNTKNLSILCFSNHPRLTEIRGISDICTDNIIAMSSMFYACNKLKKLDLAKWNVSNVRQFHSMFCNCYSLESVGDLGKWNVMRASTMSNMFYGCPHLKYIGNIGNWRVTDVVDMSYMFNQCMALRYIDGLNKWNVSNVINFRGMFMDCHKLKKLDINEWNIHGSEIGYVDIFHMFFNCMELETLGGPLTWKIEKTDPKTVFNNCYKLNPREKYFMK